MNSSSELGNSSSELRISPLHQLTQQDMIWNNLRPDEVFHWSLSRFKSSVRQLEVYARMACLKVSQEQKHW
uniref:Uncharacterized protein n=1 Tax=Acrobeloides nanus TaxID=290746 RepID=A0A914C6W2_9BILA